MDKPIVTSKVCRRCKQERPAELFGYYANTRDKLRSWCKPCHNERQRERRAANIALYRAREAANRRAQYAANPAKFNAKTKASYEANREQHIEWMREWRRRFPEKQAQSERSWRAANPDKVYAKNKRQQAQRRGAARVGPVDLDALWTGECGLCGEPLDRDARYPDPVSPSLDHIIPIVLGGSHEQSNLQWTHLLCNKKKGARPPA